MPKLYIIAGCNGAGKTITDYERDWNKTNAGENQCRDFTCPKASDWENQKRGRRVGGCAWWKGRSHQSQRPQIIQSNWEIYPRPFGRGFFFIETKATENCWKQTNGERGKFSPIFCLQNKDRLCERGIFIVPFAKFVLSFFSHNSLSINHLIVNLQAIAGSNCWTQCWTPCLHTFSTPFLIVDFQHVAVVAQW